ncbi:MAG TPA: hypothetical protein VHM65_00045 [Candidatus Lustribacter sp.]|nr:hypothetical protein [Candidatus Lustribacter sp.]
MVELEVAPAALVEAADAVDTILAARHATIRDLPTSVAHFGSAPAGCRCRGLLRSLGRWAGTSARGQRGDGAALSPARALAGEARAHYRAYRTQVARREAAGASAAWTRWSPVSPSTWP